MKNSVVFFNQENAGVPYSEHPLYDDPFRLQEPLCKIYHDGSNYVATMVQFESYVILNTPKTTSIEYEIKVVFESYVILNKTKQK